MKFLSFLLIVTFASQCLGKAVRTGSQAQTPGLGMMGGMIGLEPAVFMSTVELIEAAGFPAEVHQVTTEDGYILELHRIRSNKEQSTSVPVLVMNNPMSFSSSAWVANMRDQSLGFILSDAGFDVWLGNFRGNPYSRKHVTLNPSEEQFWKYSNDDLAAYDIPAIIDYIIGETGFQKILAVSDSLGGIPSLMTYSLKPEYNEKVLAQVVMSPIWKAKPGSVNYKIFRELAILSQPAIDYLSDALHGEKYLPNLDYFLAYVLGSLSPEIIPNMILPMLNGRNKVVGLNQTRQSVYLSHGFETSSFYLCKHLIQIIIRGQAARFDYGASGNLKKYNQEKAPLYTLDNMRVPLLLVGAQNDLLFSKELTDVLASEYSNSETHIVPFPDWIFLHFYFATNGKEGAFDQVVDFLKRKSS